MVSSKRAFYWLYFINFVMLARMINSEGIPVFKALKVVREIAAEQSQRGKGAPVRLSARKFILICKKIEVGWNATHACESEGISYRRFLQVCQQRPSHQRRYAKADQLRFEVRRERMEELVTQHAEASAHAALGWLERRIPQHWALKSVPRETDSSTRPDDQVPSEVLAEHRALQLQMAREDEAKAAAKVVELPAAGETYL
jgi:hypothetical protein